jgi:IclR family mhp operon transcriptional activator
MPSFEPVIAVVRGLQVLQILNQIREGTINDLHKASGLHKSTVLRMLDTLIHQGYVVRLENQARYRVTGKCLLLSGGFDAHEHLVRVAEPLLARFRHTVGWPSDLAIFDYDAMVIIKTNRDPGTFIPRNAGSRTPMLLSSLGRAYMAACTPSEQRQILERIETSAESFNAAVIDRPAVMRMLEETNQRGYAMPDPQYIEKVYRAEVLGFGVPIFDHNGVVGAINVMFPATAMDVDEGRAKLLTPLKNLAQEVTAGLQGAIGSVTSVLAPA